MKKSKQRNIYLDIIRGIAVFLVLWGHSVQYFGTGNINFWTNPAFKFIYSFHMPLFMLVSGYFFYYAVQKYNFVQLILNRLRTVVIPLVSWGFIMALAEYHFSHQFSFAGIILQIRNIWFLWAVLVASLFVGLVHQLYGKYKWNGIVHLEVFLLLFLAPLQLPILQEYTTLYVYPYFLLGFLYNQHKDSIPSPVKLVRFLSIPLFIYLLPQFDNNSYIYITKIDLFTSTLGAEQQLRIDLYRWLIGLAGSVMIMVVVELLIKSRYMSIILNKLFSKLGSISLQVYVTQRVLLEWFGAKYFAVWVAAKGENILTGNELVYSFVYTPLIAAFFAFVIYWLVKLLCLNKYVKFVLFGGR